MNKISFCLILALALFTASAQVERPPVPQGNKFVGVPAIALYDRDRLDDKIDQKVPEQQINHPILGRDQFNPTEFNPNPTPNQQNFPPQDPFMPRRPEEKRQNLKHHRNPYEFEGMNDDGMMRPPPRGDMPPPPPFVDHEQWERHIDGAHMQNSRFHKKIRCVFITTAIIFTLVGLCLAKCCRKCKKNRKERVQQLIRRSKTSVEISEQIRSEEKKLGELKHLYNQKKAEEQRLIQMRRQESVRQAYQMQMRQRQVAQPQVFYGQAQPYTNQVYYHPQQIHIPVGRPLNESTNSSFATEYPQI